LEFVKKDILKATTQNALFYGVVMALLKTGFTNDFESHYITEFTKEVITMSENAVNYFEKAFFLKSSNLSTFIFYF
jgi:hypothetical protein